MFESKTKIKKSRKPLIIIGVVLAAMLIVAALEAANVTHIFHHKAVPPTIPVKAQPKSSAKKSGNSTASNGQTNTQSTDKAPSSTGGGSDSGLPLVQPYGNFVSNHFPGQNGSSTKEQSACDTTPGATCFIQFTNADSGKTTKLPPQTVGSDGSTLWTWDASTLTSGKWQIAATATLNGQTKSTQDPMKLEVQ